jgi:hypothetical protein
LTTIEVFDNKNVSIYKITATTDANKRIIGMKDSNNYSNKITRDALGNFNKLEAFDNQNNLVVREEISSYDGKKNWRSAFTDWPLDVSMSYNYYFFLVVILMNRRVEQLMTNFTGLTMIMANIQEK